MAALFAPLVDPDAQRYRRRVFLIVGIIAALSLGQTLYALAIGNRFLLKDGLDWGYDVILWLVALAVFGRDRRAEDIAALGVAGVMIVAGVHTGYDLWDKIATGRRAETWVAGWSAFTAIGLALFVVVLMLRFRVSENPLVRATWLSSRNDAISTTLFASVGLAARTYPEQWPEIVLDIVLIGLAFQAAGAIMLAVWRDRRRAAAEPDREPVGKSDGQARDNVASSFES